jgi:uncharacterized cupredoxin-like copper-binding protein
MTVKLRYILIPILIACAAACEKDVKKGLFPEFVPKLVITSFVSPADTMSVFQVSTNRPIFGELGKETPLGNLSGSITDGEKEIRLHSGTGSMYFRRKELSLEPGKTYSIHINNDKGLQATGTCKVPEKFDFNMRADTFRVSTSSYYNPYSFFLKTTFRDEPGKENYYRIRVRYLTYNTSGTQKYITDNFLTNENEYFTDSFVNTEGEIGIETRLYTPGKYNDSCIIKVYLMNTEKSYYQYYRSLKDFSDNENPFQEASPVFSNIEGGLGIFTSYTIDSLIMRIRY